MSDLLAAWGEWLPVTPPFVLSGDEHVMMRPRRHPFSVVYQTWGEYAGAPDFWGGTDRSFHLGLLPVPFVGDIRSARVVILLLNPGLAPLDYFAELRVPTFRERQLRNLQQDFAGTDHPFLYLDPDFAWHSGFGWWHGKFRSVIAALARQWKCSFRDARRVVAQHLAAIELVPYHSERYRLSTPLREKLRSSALARDYVRDVLASRASVGDVLLVVGRQAQAWGIAEANNVIVYRGSEARAAHLTPRTRGGQKIVAFLEDLAPTP
jgi:hypothetical protein